jgi:DNA-binding MarR family transcriptional regulator
MQQLWALTHSLQRMSKRMESTLGVTGPQRLALRMIGRAPGISAGRVSEALRLHPSTLTGILRRLEERGLVRRKPDPADGRRALFELTPTGRKLDEQRSQTVEAAVRRALLQARPADVEAAARVLETLIVELEREASSG